jgi:hypothetical protein
MQKLRFVRAKEVGDCFHSHPTAPYESGFEHESKRGGGRRCVIGR